MPYRNIINPAADLPKVSKMIHRLEGYYLKPVHTLLKLPTARLVDPCRFVIAQTLLTAIAGASTTLFRQKGGERNRFVELMSEYYPWDREPPIAKTPKNIASFLYIHFRNPLTHSAGASINIALPNEPKIMGSSHGYSESVLSVFERADVFKPTTPTLRGHRVYGSS